MGARAEQEHENAAGVQVAFTEALSQTQQNPPNDLTNKSPEDLMNVTSVSKKEEKLSCTEAFIIKQEDIRRSTREERF